MIESLRGRDLLTLQDLEPEEIMGLVRLSAELKRDRRLFSGRLSGRSIAMIFEKPSTRTRVSLDVAVSELGGRPIYLRFDELQLGRGETIADTARVLSRYVDLITARVRRHDDLIELARWADKPVVNALSDLDHPLQTLADLFTIWERFGRIQGVKVAWVGDGNNVCNSILIGATKLGAHISIACPRGYEPNKKYLEWAMENSRKSGSKVEVVEDPEEAVKDADVVMTDVFVSMGMEAERERRMQDFLPRYQVSGKLMRLAKPGAIFMHPLPAKRGEEVSPEVIDGEWSAVWDQAENRLHTAKAVLLSILG
ncbi:MAG: ornithine carbamoyltransferase [Thaumarchaeota archaeon]|nr:ornithine carbamoyltransferase [Nitrososphaerota archaeon]MCL7386287.1 ornithine carbamoyltransferase [Candidatus Wolframiiraptor allenii]MCL7393935.1 ornithine carbamoyltransferase [Candidatus Wolframiiraptor allenii]